ncbi:MAG: hypothetical protein Q4C82_06260 [Eubacteriales bacterium]|nr:hypothetical protein [Eubacteriales bacterium]
MRWYRRLYAGPNAALHMDRIREKASAGAWMAGVYYITLSRAEGGLLEIFHNTMLRQPVFEKLQRLDVVGVAEGRSEALRLTETIVRDVYEKTGGFDMEAWFPDEEFQTDRRVRKE